MKQLIVMRHATAEGLTASSDFERPLTSEGRLEAERVGQWLKLHAYVPQLALCSTAARVEETWAALTRGLGESPPVRFERAIYEADAAELMQQAGEIEQSPDCVILIGHNPSITHFAFDLTGCVDPEGRERLRGGFRPATAAVFRLRGEACSELEAKGATLLDLVEARALA